MVKRERKIIKALALLLLFSMFYLSMGTAVLLAATPQPQAITARLTTRGNQAITVNGISANSGDTILTGSSIETGDQVGATINLGSLGILEIAPNTKLQLTFKRDGTVEVTLIEGCIILRVKDGTYGVINTAQGKIASNDSIKKQAAVLDVCLPKGAPEAIVNQGAAANAGAGAGVAVGGTTVAGEGLSGAVVGGLLAGGAGLAALGLIIANRGENSSASS